MTWFKVDDQIPDHRKVRRLAADRLPAMGLWTLCGAWASRNSDGFVPQEVVTRYDPEQRYARVLVGVGLWHEAVEDGEIGFTFHDWLEYRSTKERDQKKRDDTKRRVQAHRGRKRAEQAERDATGRFEPQNEPPPEDEEVASNAHGNALQDEQRNATGNPAPDPTRPVPEERSVGGHSSSEIADATSDSDQDEEPREDVEALCQHLAERVEANGSKRPRITKTWRREARLLLDRDGRDLDKAHNLIDWSQGHHHWKTRVMAMPKFRGEYDAMRLQALEDHKRQRGQHPTPRVSASDAAAAQAQSLRRTPRTQVATPAQPEQPQLRIAEGF